MKILNYFSLLLLLVCTGISQAAVEKLSPDRVHMVTTLEILQKLQVRHFEKHAIDDTLSSKLLDAYLDALDSNHQVLMQSEVDDFKQQYASKLDDALKQGNVTPAYRIFNLYRERMIDQLEKQLADLPGTIKKMDFTANEALTVDRSKLPWPADQKAVDELWRKRLKAAALSLKLAGKETDDIAKLLGKRYQNQLERMQQLRSEDVYQIYMNTFTQLYDPHTNYMSPANAENFDISMSLKLEGIGAMLRSEDEYTKVVRLITAGPADKQGELQPSDKIIGVGQGKEEIVDVVGWRLDEVVDLIRGPKGSTVRLEVIPGKAADDSERKIISIVRDEVKLEDSAVQKAMLDINDEQGKPHKIGVLDIPTFYHDFEARHNGDPNYRSTKRDLARALTELQEEGAEGMVIDLRNNGGGSLLEAIEVTGLFVERGPSVQTKSSNNQIHTYPTGDDDVVLYKGPVVVLINRLSASASEIFAGALQDYKRAVIVGSQSFGKGTVQSLLSLNHGKLKLTESKFYRISGESTQNRGVLPDITLPKVYDPELVGESALDNAMKWDTIPPAFYRSYYDFSSLLPELQLLSAKRGEKNPDFQFLHDKMAYEASLKVNEISLNEKKRRAEREKDKTERLALLNRLHKAKGEPLQDKLEEPDIDTDEAADNEDDTHNKIDTKDPFLVESAHVLLDVEHLMQEPKLAK